MTKARSAPLALRVAEPFCSAARPVSVIFGARLSQGGREAGEVIRRDLARRGGGGMGLGGAQYALGPGEIVELRLLEVAARRGSGLLGHGGDAEGTVGEAGAPGMVGISAARDRRYY